MTKIDIHWDLRLVQKEDQICSEIDEEIVMLNVNAGEYYNLNQIGSDIWKFLEKPTAFGKLIEYLLNKYDVTKERCIMETRELLLIFLEKEIIKIINEENN